MRATFFMFLGSRTIAPPKRDSNSYPRPNPKPKQGTIFLGGNFQDTMFLKDFFTSVRRQRVHKTLFLTKSLVHYSYYLK